MLELSPGNYYHIYNRAISGSLLFYNDENYDYFLRKFKEYLGDFVNIYSYCLLPNHFHFLMSSKDVSKEVKISRVFANFFNCYSKSINKQESRHGSLFNKPFKRRLIENEDYLRLIVNYIHRNPIHHKICDQISEYKWSSYNSIRTGNNEMLDVKCVISWFGDFETFQLYLEHSIEDYRNMNLEQLKPDRS